MLEICKFAPEEIDEAIAGLDGLQDIIVPVLLKNTENPLRKEDAVTFQRHIMLAKHALIAMGDFLEKKMGEKKE